MVYKEMSCGAIHDLSGVGKCSLTVVLPVLSACGVETSVLPTAVLSTHTGGFSDLVYRDLTKELLPIAQHWKKEGCRFSALYSGFLGSTAQIGMVEEVFRMFREPGTLILVDPVMGDGGKLYSTYTEEMADGMARLCGEADVVVPNMTEASHILGIPYSAGPYTEEEVEDVLSGLCKLGPSMAVLTGVSLDGKSLGAACRDTRKGKTEYFLLPKVEGVFHGTGDLFASVLLGGLLNGMMLGEACKLAVEFTHRAVETTKQYSHDTRFGPKFECHLPWLGAQLEAYRSRLS